MKNSESRCLVLGVHSACLPLQGVSPQSPHRELMNFSTGDAFSGDVPEPASLQPLQVLSD